MSPPHLLCGLSYIPRARREGDALSRPGQGWGSQPSETLLFSFSCTFVHSHCPLAGAGFQFSFKEESDVTVRDAGQGAAHILVLGIQYQRMPNLCHMLPPVSHAPAQEINSGGGDFNSKWILLLADSGSDCLLT